ncbi:MAG: cytochrome c, partial [Chloroflexota bacterium]
LLGSAQFTDFRQMADLAPRDLYLIVTQGRGSMPSWQSRLSQEERWQVIDYIRTFTYDPLLPSEGGLPATTPMVAATACTSDQVSPYSWEGVSAIQAGRAIFESRCAACHGQDGSGGLPDTPDFTSAEESQELRHSPGGHFCVLTDGVGSMPAFGSTLSEQERWQVLIFLASLGP